MANATVSTAFWRWSALIANFVHWLVLRLTVVHATRGASFTDHDPTQRGQGQLELMPNPTRNVFARWILQSLHFVQVVVVDLVFNCLESALDVSEVDNPTRLWIDRTLNVNFDLEAMAMQTTTFVPGGYVWEAVGRFDREYLENLRRFSFHRIPTNLCV